MLPGPLAQPCFSAKKSVPSDGWACWSFALALRSSGSAAAKTFLIRLPRLGLLRIDLRGIADLNSRREALVVRIVNRNPHVHFVGIFEMQHVIGARVRRKPEMAFDIFAVVFEMRKRLVLFLL